ncbi:hypothetical protein Hypma_001314 [Hypsizygus marmoreus]|uniref:Uncharacterized protein n=1 Tax=Hypsizygus marmoreus TaxID=39966 RepID=A0A369K8Y5_HYPMA|nr:hypothetical protein Hypma_001314 [Hypsizygus marmoreus]
MGPDVEVESKVVSPVIRRPVVQGDMSNPTVLDPTKPGLPPLTSEYSGSFGGKHQVSVRLLFVQVFVRRTMWTSVPAVAVIRQPTLAGYRNIPKSSGPGSRT